MSKGTFSYPLTVNETVMDISVLQGVFFLCKRRRKAYDR
jgi:hypothetical protein